VVDLKQQGKRFGFTFYKWTSIKNRRYSNLNIHLPSYFWNLGLVRNHGSLPAESCLVLVDKRLKDYGLKMNDGDNN
jgi:hypothetical protein